MILTEREKIKLRRMERMKNQQKITYGGLLCFLIIAIISIILGIMEKISQNITVGLFMIVLDLLLFTGVREQLKLYGIIEKLKNKN